MSLRPLKIPTRFYALLIRDDRTGREYLTPWSVSRAWFEGDKQAALWQGHTPIAVITARER